MKRHSLEEQPSETLPVVSPWHRRLGPEWLLWGGIVLAAGAFGATLNLQNRRTALEVLLDVMVISGLTAVPVWARYVTGLNPVRRLFLMIMVGLLFLGQFAHRDLRLFPFINWAMYSGGTPGDAVTHERIFAILDDDSRILINPERLFPSLGMGTHRLANAISQRLNQALVEKDQESTAAFNALLASIFEAQRRFGDHGRAIRSLEVVRVSLPVSKKHGPESSREIVWRWEPS